MIMKLNYQDIKSIIQEEVKRFLYEYRGQRYWIDPSGRKHKINILHIEWIADHRHEFESIPNDFDTRNVMDPDESQIYFFMKGWVNLHVFDNEVNVEGVRRYIEEFMDEIISNNPDKKYTVTIYDDYGDFEEEYLSLSLDEFMTEFGNSRKRRSSKSKVSRFR